MVKRLIVTLIRKEIATYHKKLKKELKQKFNVKQALKTNPPSHITLKYNFKNDKLPEVKKILQSFANNTNPSAYEIRGVNSFGKKVIYLEIHASKKMKEDHKSLLNKLKNNDIALRRFDEPKNYHCTLALRDINEKYDEIMSYMRKKTIEFEASFDNVAILKLENNTWIIEEKYDFI